MSQHDTQEPTQLEQMKPYLIAAGILFLVLVIAFFWPSSDSSEPLVSAPINVVIPAKDATPNNGSDDSTQADDDELSNVEPADLESEVAANGETELFVGTPDIQSLEIGVNDNNELEIVEPEIVEVEPEPLDESDGAVKSALISLATNPAIAKYLVDESLLQKFVINVNNIANQEMSPNHNLINEPDGDFQVYQQAEREWIDAASFKRYNPYVEALESMEAEDLVALLNTYRPTIEDKFAEISMPGSSFDNTLLAAINELLDTPIVPLPIEVYSDSVMYKYRDDKLENLSGPQKQLLRTGPENARKIKDILRDLRDAIEDQD
jgi:hypothetical protein